MAGAFKNAKSPTAAAEPAPPAPRPVKSGPATEAEAPARMTAKEAERALAAAPASSVPPTSVRCLRGEYGWDYVCTYQSDPAKAWSRLKIGVRVGSDRILQASTPHLLGQPLPQP